ncbi:MAG: MBL fold metallo-hydrolase [Clostridia bacterium]|nr:MBL fold metallo-hydrolase [Clostridia bacterium]
MLKKFEVGYMPTNCYVLSDGEIAVIVDPGGGYGKISAYLNENGLNPVAVLLTHGHFDHILDVHKWQKEGVDIFIHEDEASCLFTPEENISSMIGLTIPPVRMYKTFSDGDVLTFGKLSFKVIHTPGHTKGSCCFIMDDGSVLTGDTLMCETYGRTDFPGGSTDRIVSSIKDKLFSLEGDRLIYPGHGDSSTLNHERRFNPVLYL